jgi:hypothetical protein
MTCPLQGVNEDLLLPRKAHHHLVVQSDHLLEQVGRDLPAPDTPMRMRMTVAVPDGPLADALTEEVPRLDVDLVAPVAGLSHMIPKFPEHSPKESLLFVTLCLTLLPCERPLSTR